MNRECKSYESLQDENKKLRLKLDRIKKIVSKYDGSVASIITGFGNIQKELENE